MESKGISNGVKFAPPLNSNIQEQNGATRSLNSRAGFVHLHTHTHYSLLDGLTRVDELVERTKELGMEAAAITDHGAMYGVVEFYQKAKKAGIKPIIGVEVYITENMHDKRPNANGKNFYHLVLLAENNIGYKNLIKLVTAAHLEGFYYKPRIDRELLRQHSAGLIGLSGCLSGEISRAILSRNDERAKKLALEYRDIFGRGNFYLELQYHPHLEEQAILNKKLLEFSKELEIPLVATQDSHYPCSEDARAHDVLLAVQTGNQVDDRDRLTLRNDDFSFLPPEKMIENFKDIPEAIENTVKIAERCNVEIELGKTKLPEFPLPAGYDADGYLKKLAYEGLTRRYKTSPGEAIITRLDYELGIIEKTGFASYFLIVQDFVDWAKKQGIIIGPGRGSAASSLVSYLLNITNIDPLKYDLLFERFLTLERISPPDIDLDFDDARRGEVFDYVRKKYGNDHFAQVITFGTMAARGGIRDAGRALGFSYDFCDRIAKLIPFNPNQNEKLGFLRKCLEDVEELRQLYNTNNDAKTVVDVAMRLEGVARHSSTHACAVVITPQSLTEYVPLQRDTGENNIVTQYEMHAVEDLGLLKMDFLGLSNLTIIGDALRLIEQNHGVKINIDEIPLDDKETFKLFREGRTTGVFQLEGSGMRRYLKELKPTVFEDISSMIALYRPGPIELIPEYIARKHGKKPVQYLHPKLEPILKKTHGICITGDSLIQTTNPGCLASIEELVRANKWPKVQSLQGDRFVKQEIVTKFNNGLQDVYKIVLRTGKYITATAAHEFLTPFGWKKLGELKTGSFIATPKKLITGNKAFDLDKLKVLAYLLADGSFANLNSCYFVNKSRVLIDDYRKCAQRTFEDTKISVSKYLRDVMRAVPSKINKTSSNYHVANSLLRWIRELGLKDMYGGKKSDQKFIPSFIFELKPRFIAAFLATMWDCDGGATSRMAYLTTISKRMAFDIQTLLLKLGLNGHVYEAEKYRSRKNKLMTAYRICVYDTAAFYRKIGQFMLNERKRDNLIRDRQNIKGVSEYFPRKTFLDKVLNYLKKNKISQRSFCKKLHINRGGFFKIKNRIRNKISLNIAKKIAYFINDKELVNLVNTKSIRWEDVVHVDYAGKRRVYDLEVKDTHNFIANNIITHNCIYQEQLMASAQALAGFTLPQADTLRKAVGKKIKKLLQEQKDKVIQGCLANGISMNIAEKFWKLIEPFDRYGFNRSHSISYAMIAYQTAYLKAHYPVEFMAALMNSASADVERIAFLIEECQSMGVEVLPPEINESMENFNVVPVLTPGGDSSRRIRFGLAAIKNVGINIVQAIIEERKKTGPFKDVENFVSRVQNKDLNKKSLESLVKCGALDVFGERAALLANIEQLLYHSRESQKARTTGQVSLFDGPNLAVTLPPLRLVETVGATRAEKLMWEKELLGLFISDHPLKDYQQKLDFEKGLVKIKDLPVNRNNIQVKIGGIVTKIQKVLTKSGKPMIFSWVEDTTSKIEVVAFPNILEANPDAFKENNVLVIRGKLNDRDGIPKLMCDEVRAIATVS